MRRGNDSDFVFDGDVMVGVSLGSDFTSEHECGISEIRQYFGIPSGEKDWGLDRRKVKRLPNSDTFGWTAGFDSKGEGFYLLDTWDSRIPDFSKDSELRPYSGQTLACAWDGGSFGVFSTSPEEIRNLRQIYDAFMHLDGMIFLGGGKMFQNSGLILAIASRVPQELIDKQYAADKDAYDLNQEVETMGIRQLLKEKNCGYHALSPRRNEDGSIRFWLNPHEQKQNHYGWFTLDDLKEWAEGKGKIPMRASDG